MDSEAAGLVGSVDSASLEGPSFSANGFTSTTIPNAGAPRTTPARDTDATAVEETLSRIIDSVVFGSGQVGPLSVPSTPSRPTLLDISGGAASDCTAAFFTPNQSPWRPSTSALTAWDRADLTPLAELREGRPNLSSMATPCRTAASLLNVDEDDFELKLSPSPLRTLHPEPSSQGQGEEGENVVSAEVAASSAMGEAATVPLNEAPSPPPVGSAEEADRSIVASEKGGRQIIDAQTTNELLTHIHFYLASKPEYACIAGLLKGQMEISGNVPPRYDFTGSENPQLIDHYVSAQSQLPLNARPPPNATFQLSSLRPYSTDLESLVSRLGELANQSLPLPTPSVPLPLRLFASRRMALTRRQEGMDSLAANYRQSLAARRPSIPALEASPQCRLLTAREMGTRLPARLLLKKELIYESMRLHARLLGHLSPVFCVKFDQTGRYIFTGADDNLVKVWDARRCLLRCTLRGHSGEIVDMAVSNENTLLATGSIDKTVRVWCLRSGATVHVARGHTAMITYIQFLPFVAGDVRYMVSAGNDCQVFFHRYNVHEPGNFGDIFKFGERSAPGRKIFSACHSPGGNLVAMGDSHQHIRIYLITAQHVDRLYELSAHTDHIDSLVWAHAALRFASGSKDGKAKVWALEAGNRWKCTELVVAGATNTPATASSSSRRPSSFKVNMVGWSLQDDYVVTASSDYLLRVWDWQTGEVVRTLAGHVNHSYVLWCHPMHPELFASGSHDGTVVLWDVYKGEKVKEWINDSTDPYTPTIAVFDMMWSADGATLAFVDAQGQLSILSVGENAPARAQPREQFFNTDYQPLIHDHNGFALDEHTELAPHLMPPPLLCDAHNAPYTDEAIQRQVPGRDLQGINSLFHDNDLLCPWLKRPVVPPLSTPIDSQHYMLGARERLKEAEFAEYQRLQTAVPSKPEKPSPKSQASAKIAGSGTGPRRRAAINARRRLAARAPAAPSGQSAPIQTPHRPPSSIVNNLHEYGLSDNDSTYSGGEGLAGGDRGSENGGSSASSVTTENSLGRGGDDVEFDDEYDSDFSLGHHEHETVFRTRSAFTVTGRPKRRPAPQHDGDEGGGENSQPGPSLTAHPLLLANSDGVPTLATNGGNGQETRRRQMKVRRKIIKKEPSAGPSSRQPKRRMTRSQGHRPMFIDSSASADSATEAEPVDVKPRLPTMSKKNAAKKRVKLEPESVARSGGLPTSYPEWMRVIRRRRFPYFAQLGDVVVYFLQGHMLYQNAAIESHLYPLTRRMVVRDDLDATEVCIVDGVRYEHCPYRLCVVRLSPYRNGSRMGASSFEIYFHDMDNVADFLVLKQHYDAAIAADFKAGSQVEAIVDEKWFTGVVQERRVHCVDYPSSAWFSLRIRWDNGEEGEKDGYSPWDLQPKHKGRKSETPALEADLAHLGDYDPIEGDWPLGDPALAHLTPLQARDAYFKRAKLALAQIMECAEATPFLYPVDLNAYPGYIDVVPYPIDLQTIDERIGNQFYRRYLPLLQDIQYIAKNAHRFNEPSERICWQAAALVEAFFQHMVDFSIPHAGDTFHELCNSTRVAHTWKMRLSTPANASVHLADEASERGRMARKEGPVTSSSVSPSKWISECRAMAEQIIAPMNGYPEIRDNIEVQTALKELMEQRIERLESPASFRDAFGELLRDFKERIEETTGSKRSKAFQQLLKLEAELQAQSRSICAKFHRMTGVSGVGDRSDRKPRAAALNAVLTWKRDLNGRQLHPSSAAHHNYNTRRHQRQGSTQLMEVEEAWTEPDPNEPCSSNSLPPQFAASNGYYAAQRDASTTSTASGQCTRTAKKLNLRILPQRMPSKEPTPSLQSALLSPQADSDGRIHPYRVVQVEPSRASSSSLDRDTSRMGSIQREGSTPSRRLVLIPAQKQEVEGTPGGGGDEFPSNLNTPASAPSRHQVMGRAPGGGAVRAISIDPVTAVGQPSIQSTSPALPPASENAAEPLSASSRSSSSEARNEPDEDFSLGEADEEMEEADGEHSEHEGVAAEEEEDEFSPDSTALDSSDDDNHEHNGDGDGDGGAGEPVSKPAPRRRRASPIAMEPERLGTRNRVKPEFFSPDRYNRGSSGTSAVAGNSKKRRRVESSSEQSQTTEGADSGDGSVGRKNHGARRTKNGRHSHRSTSTSATNGSLAARRPRRSNVPSSSYLEVESGDDGEIDGKRR